MTGVAMDRGAAMTLALEWAARGVPAFPIKIVWDDAKDGTNKIPLCEHGFLDASTDARQIRGMFNKSGWSGAWGVGLRPGPAGYLVPDVDGIGNVELFEARDLPATYAPTTASGARHYWYRKPADERVGTACSWPEVDVIRSDDGFIVAPGTTSPWGDWECFDEFPDDVAVCPPELWDAIDHGTTGGGGGASSTVDARGLDVVLERLRADGRDQDADVLDVLVCRYGGHHPFLKADGEVFVTRPDKRAGTSASVGYVAPGVVKVFSSDWPPFKKNGRYVLNDDGTELVSEDGDRAPADTRGSTSEVLPSDEVITPDVVDPDRFFGKQGLLHASLRCAVLEYGAIVTGPGCSLWRYHDGVYLPDGADEVRRRGRHLLGQRWRRSHVEGVVADLAANHAFITDEQPADWINCRNGLLHWRTGELHEHRPDVASTYQLAVGWNPDATCPTVDAWLAQVVPDDAIGLVWEIIGTAIYGDQPFHRAVLLLGPGRNGKGTLLRLITALIGRRHISAVTLQMLGESRFAAASLFGKVANIAGDLDARAIGRTDVFKMATGGDLIEAEHKYGAAFTFRNRATFLFSANEPPGSSDHTEGFFARWVVIPFTRLQLAPGQEDPSIETRMHAELAGVLVRAVDGLRRAMDRGGYDRPASVIAATDGYRSDADPMRRFIDDRLDVTGHHGDTETRQRVYATYRQWCDDNGHRPLATNKFWSRLVTIEPSIDPNRKMQGVRFAAGIVVRSDDWTPTGPQGQQGAAPTTPPRTHGGKLETAAPAAPDELAGQCDRCGSNDFDADGWCLTPECIGIAS